MKTLFLLVHLTFTSPGFDINQRDPIELIECIYWQRDKIRVLQEKIDYSVYSVYSPEMRRLMSMEEVQRYFEDDVHKIIPKHIWDEIYETNWPDGFPIFVPNMNPQDHEEYSLRNRKCSNLLVEYEKYLAKSGIIYRYGWSKNKR